MRTIRSLTRKSEGIHAGKRCMTMTVAGWSKGGEIGGFCSRLAEAPEVVAGRSVTGSLPGSAELPRAAHQVRPEGGARADLGYCQRGHVDPAAALSLLLPSSPHSSLTRGSISLFCLASISSGETGLSS